VILAELEAYQSRPIAPTRRIALGRLDLPCDPAPGSGGVLLGGILARFVPELDEDATFDVVGLLADVERGLRIAQPRARHRFQADRVGLRPCHHRLVGRGDAAVLHLDDTRGTPAQHVLCAIYAAATLPASVRPAVITALRKGLQWRGSVGPALVAHLAGRGGGVSVSASADPVGWAMQVLRLELSSDVGEKQTRKDEPVTGTHRPSATVPTRRDVQQAFRVGLRAAHPDHGAEDDGAAQRIAELSEARRILLG